MAVIAIVTSTPPLTDGGHLVLARSLEQALRRAGHQAGIVTTPSNRFGRQGAAYVANWLTDVGIAGTGERVDQVISMRYPSYAVRHPQHVCWLVHTMREYYDLWDAYSGSLSVGGRLKERARRTWVHAADSYCFKHHVNRLFTISGTVRSRLERWNGVTGAVLHPPPPQRDYRCDEYGDFVFWASRLTRLKRADLLLRALARPETKGVRCVLAGEGPERERLLALRRDLGLESRVAMPGHLSEGQLLDHLARCRAVVFVPFQEDYGFVTVEAFAAGKPVITCDDSGGPVELVRHGENGWVVPPTADGVARAVVEAMDDDVARRRGAQGQVDIAPLTWDRVVDALVIV